MVKARTKEVIGIEAALFTAELIWECSRCRVFYSLENPISSKLWGFEPISRLLGLPGAGFVKFDMCRFGASFRKPTSLFTNLPGLKILMKRCNHNFRHTVLSGSVKISDASSGQRWISATSAAGAYPIDLCEEWAKVLQASCPDGAVGGESPWEASWAKHLQSLVRRKLSLSAFDLGDEKACALPGRALRYLQDHTVTFGGSVGPIKAGAHCHTFKQAAEQQT